MAHLKKSEVAVFLNVTLQTLSLRVSDFSTRGLAKGPDQSLDDLSAERFSLYMQYADVVLDCYDITHEEVFAAIVKELEARSGTKVRSVCN